MKKFFLFRRKDINVTSSAFSDNGEGLDVLAISTDLLSFMTASLGKVHIVFNDATIYEQNNLLDGEGFRKTSVSVACEEGQEASVIESIMKFIASEKTSTNIMRFDAVEGKATVGHAKVQDFKDVVAEVKQSPVLRSTQEISKKTARDVANPGKDFKGSSIIAGIDFGEGNKPVIDLNEEGLSENSGAVDGWVNSGSGGSTYNAGTITGTIPFDTTTTRLGSGLSTASADFGSNDNIAISTAYTQQGDFTMYAVVGFSTTDILDNPKMGHLVQGSASSGSGLTFMFNDPFDSNKFKFQFNGEKSAFVEAPTVNRIIQSDQPVASMRTAYVFVIRRDSSFNISVCDNEGSVIAFAPAKTDGHARTDLDVVIGFLGNKQGIKFQGNVGRFGVIDKDIGTSSASQLALDLAKKYTPIT